ncbi:GtrA family protein [Lysobacter capsici]|uniref:GtrA family protein n=1 Tax=Lysobacter capsici TaxID=435897 RepID=UPI00287B6315|nr:GtrA family protein [Lysobacter capsici]WND81461.1 GtrA family protein [Lysobacter capsici]WND86657.1 GtrA family protein [Lysobacter capsici]
MSLGRQGRNYLLFGALQYFLDWGMMVGLSHLGMPVEAANLTGRICGALLGFWLNGRFTFASEDTRVGRRQFARFVTMWICTTILSTWAISAVDAYAGLQWTWAAKPVIEVILGGVGFVMSRHWVYRR